MADDKPILIPYNPTGRYDGSSREAIERFKGVLERSTDCGHGASHARPRHRGRLRAARLGALVERVTGIGGVLFRARDAQALVTWYEQHLGVPLNEGYAISPASRYTVWSPRALAAAR